MLLGASSVKVYECKRYISWNELREAVRTLSLSSENKLSKDILWVSFADQCLPFSSRLAIRIRLLHVRNISRRESGLRPNSIVLVQNGWSPNELAQWDQNYFELALFFLYHYDFTRYFPKFQSLIQRLKTSRSADC